jgi:PAS domain S-box-containing protein
LSLAGSKQRRQTADEVRNLKACVNDLIGMMALQAVWSDGEPRKIVTTLLDVLLHMLRLDLVYVVLNLGGGADLEVIQQARSRNSISKPEAISQVLNSLVTAPRARPSVLKIRNGDRDLSLATVRLGLKDEKGVLVAGSRRIDFPTKTERLLLNVAANQAAIGLHEARLLSGQRLVAADLDHQVAQRTEELERFFHISLDLLSISDHRGHFRRLNEAWEKTLGYDRSELLTIPFMDLVHPEDVDKTQIAYADLIARRNIVNFVNRYRCKDGTYRWLEWSAASGDELIYAAARDISDRKHAQDSLRQVQARLSRATQVATVAELAASIAHEINQPLAAVVANGHAALGWLSGNPPNLERARQAVERIVRDGKDAGDVVQRIRSLFSGAVPQETALDINALITEAVRLAEGETLRKQIVVETNFGENLPLAAGDRMQLQQVILNLLLNGIEALDSVVDRPRRIFIRTELHRFNMILVEIADNGVGIKNPERIFEAFFTTKKAGMGMGLAISRSIVEGHHGRLWVEPGDEIGATFRFTLPPEGSSVT